MHPRFLLPLALVCTLALPCSAQRRHAAATPAPAAAPADPASDKVKVDAIKYTGTGAADYSEADFAAATGLSAGLLLNADIQDAATKLANSGQFGEVGFAEDGTTLTYTITAAEKLLPVHFEDFVWWTDIDLLREVHAKCPLFLGTLGGKGTLLPQVTDVLTAMATAKAGTPAKVEQNLLAHPGQAAYAVGFTIVSPSIVVARVELSHASMDLSSAVAQVSRKMAGQPYNRDAVKEYLLSKLGDAYAAEGYIDFAIKQLQATDPKPTDSGFSVTVRGDLDSGKLYHVAALNWTDTPQMNKAAFDAMDAFKVGDVAALGPLQTTLHSIERNYQHQGYVNAKATVVPTLDHENATVSYTFSVVPGTAFHTSD